MVQGVGFIYKGSYPLAKAAFRFILVGAFAEAHMSDNIDRPDNFH